MHTALNAVFQYDISLILNGLKHSLQIAKLVLLKCTEVRKNSFYKLRNNPSYQAFVFSALHIFDIKMPYCVIVPNSTTYTHTLWPVRWWSFYEEKKLSQGETTLSTDNPDFLSWHKIVNGGRGSSISHVMEASGWTTIVGRYLLQGLALHHPSFAPLLPATTTTALKITDFEEKTGLVCNRLEDGWQTTASTLRPEWSLTAVATMILLELPILSGGSTWQLMSIACNTQWLKFAHRRCFFFHDNGDRERNLIAFRNDSTRNNTTLGPKSSLVRSLKSRGG